MRLMTKTPGKRDQRGAARLPSGGSLFGYHSVINSTHALVARVLPAMGAGRRAVRRSGRGGTHLAAVESSCDGPIPAGRERGGILVGRRERQEVLHGHGRRSAGAGAARPTSRREGHPLRGHRRHGAQRVGVPPRHRRRGRAADGGGAARAQGRGPRPRLRREGSPAAGACGIPSRG
jgi:hypothetical protein